MKHCLGKLPARKGSIFFAWSHYFDTKGLPAVPEHFGRYWKLPADWGALGNNDVGDCVLAAFAHMIQSWQADAGAPVTFTDEGVISSYSDVTGYVPGDESTDQGTDVAQGSRYFATKGIPDRWGVRHSVDAFVSLEPSNLDQLKEAAWVLGVAGLGLRFPESAMKQTDAGQPWSVVPRAKIKGGHYVAVVGVHPNGNFLVVTWGALQQATPDFVEHYMDEGEGYLNIARVAKRFPAGFSSAKLADDMKARGMHR